MLCLAHDWVLDYFWVWARLYKWERFIWNLPMLGLQPCFLVGALLALHRSPMDSKQLTSSHYHILSFLFFFFSLTESLLGKEKTYQVRNDGIRETSLCGIKEHTCCLLCKYNMLLAHHLWLCGHLSLRPWHVLAIVSKIRHPLLEAGKMVLNLGPL